VPKSSHILHARIFSSYLMATRSSSGAGSSASSSSDLGWEEDESFVQSQRGGNGGEVILLRKRSKVRKAASRDLPPFRSRTIFKSHTLTISLTSTSTRLTSTSTRMLTFNSARGRKMTRV